MRRKPASMRRAHGSIAIRPPSSGARACSSGSVRTQSVRTSRASPPWKDPPETLAAGLRAFAEAGADEVIVVCDPITEASITHLGPVLAMVRG